MNSNYEHWSRHNKNLYEKYVDPFIFEISGKTISIKQQNVIKAEDLV